MQYLISAESMTVVESAVIYSIKKQISVIFLSLQEYLSKAPSNLSPTLWLQGVILKNSSEIKHLLRQGNDWGLGVGGLGGGEEQIVWDVCRPESLGCFVSIVPFSYL